MKFYLLLVCCLIALVAAQECDVNGIWSCDYDAVLYRFEINFDDDNFEYRDGVCDFKSKVRFDDDDNSFTFFDIDFESDSCDGYLSDDEEIINNDLDFNNDCDTFSATDITGASYTCHYVDDDNLGYGYFDSNSNFSSSSSATMITVSALAAIVLLML
eukprot:TRINITY_DN989_c0_g1_i2.p1 TRINITY_DN989_c0_g1~~TRINITY_DN989_c0_g1_i2.p1  ORF type:complete len:158 (-),score=52.67 TRINITY_DN989_c0_g1_i2:168-641(-)